jgi:hypothetical protein
MNTIWSIVVFCLIFIVIRNPTNAEVKPSLNYQRLASLYCYIDDYPAWLEQQSLLEYFLTFAQFFDVDTNLIKETLEQYRLQYECLRTLERRPILIGGG